MCRGWSKMILKMSFGTADSHIVICISVLCCKLWVGIYPVMLTKQQKRYSKKCHVIGRPPKLLSFPSVASIRPSNVLGQEAPPF